MILDENGNGSSLAELLRTLSTLLVVQTEAAPVRDTRADAIYTWRSFRLVRVLARRPLQEYYRCPRSSPRRLSLGAGEVAFPLIQGTAVVDGVAVTMDSCDWILGLLTTLSIVSVRSMTRPVDDDLALVISARQTFGRSF